MFSDYLFNGRGNRTVSGNKPNPMGRTVCNFSRFGCKKGGSGDLPNSFHMFIEQHRVIAPFNKVIAEGAGMGFEGLIRVTYPLYPEQLTVG